MKCNQLILYLFFSILGAQQVQLNEIVSTNGSTLFDEDGDSPDWIEIFNPNEENIDLTGFSLSDDPEELDKWILPEITIEPGSFLVIFASNKDRTDLVVQWDAAIDWGDTLFYWLGTSPPVSDWSQLSANLSGWLTGPSGFGYGDNDDNTNTGQVVSVFVKQTFQISDPENVSKLLFHLDYDDGYIAYLNGNEFSRKNMGAPNTEVDYNQPATGLHEAEIYSGGFPEPVWIDLSEFPLNDGNNILAIEVHNYNSSSSDLSCIPFLTLGYRSNQENIEIPNANMNLPNISLHTNFKISSTGETITLANNLGMVLDSVYTGILQTDMSRGRYLEGLDWTLFGDPTPGTTNNAQPYTNALSKPIYSIPSGYYASDGSDLTISLSLSSTQPDAEIRFTMDHSDPSPFSQLYEYPIPINENTVIKARAFLTDWLPSRTESKTYIFDNQQPLPTVFINTEPDNLFDQDSGIYVMGSSAEENFPYFGANFWEDWERPAHFEILETDGTGYGANAGIKIFGGWSRGFPHKSLAIYARNYYGPSQFDYNLFPNSEIDSYEAFTLRNSGNDWESTMLRDGFITSLADNLNIDHLRYRPAVVYINGDFWGIQNIREKVNEHFVAANHDLVSSNIDLLEVNGTAIHGTNTDYNNLLDYLENQDINDPIVHNAIEQWIDIESYMSYQAFQIIIDNRDWPGNNIKYWRDHRVGGKWRWILYDTDFGFGIWDATAYTFNTLNFALDPNGPGWPNPPWSTFLFRKIMENDDFKFSFINIYCDLLNTVFQPEYLTSHLDSISNNIQNTIPAHRSRWYNNGNWPNSTVNWQSRLNTMMTFGNNRQSYAKSHLRNKFNLPSDEEISLHIEPMNSGIIQLNSLIIDKDGWSGSYFPTIPLSVKARPKDGYVFSGWAEFPDSSSSMIINFSDSIILTALFEVSDSSADDIVINEINYNSSDNFNPEDWIELYNPGAADANISGWVLKDEDNDHVFSIPSGTVIENQGYLVLAENLDVFLISFPDAENVIGSFDFGLSGGGDQVRIYNNNGDLIDSLEYDDENGWPESADGDGPTLELINPEMDNALPISWASSTANGTPGEINSTFQVLGSTDENIVPSRSALGIAFPNPFNPQVTIPFQLAETGAGKIKIINVLGQEVASFDLDRLVAGKHIFIWKPSDNYNTSSGIFFIQMNTKNSSSVKKIVYLK